MFTWSVGALIEGEQEHGPGPRPRRPRLPLKRLLHQPRPPLPPAPCIGGGWLLEGLLSAVLQSDLNPYMVIEGIGTYARSN